MTGRATEPQLDIEPVELDEGVRARLARFREQWDAAPPNRVPAFLFVPDLPSVRGACFSCGDRLRTAEAIGRCWRCAVAWRLVAGVPLPADLANGEGTS